MGVLHSPIVMTSSLAIGRAYDATVRWRTLRHDTTTHEGGDMPFVCECDDSYLSDVTSFPLEEDVFAALDAAAPGDVAEGCVGAGTGTQCMDFKGGVGTSSRTIPGGWTVGALVLTNFGERELLRIDGVPVGREITDLMPAALGGFGDRGRHRRADGPHQVRRLAVRGGLGLARCGSTGHNGSGELMIAFSTANRIPLRSPDGTIPVRAVLDGPGQASPDVFNEAFAATVEAVEEAVVNALFTAETTIGRDGNVLHALPLDRTLEILARHGRGPRSRSDQSKRLGPDECLPRLRRLDLVLAPARDDPVPQLHDDETVVLAVASVGVLADPDVTVDDEVVPLHPHRGRVLPSEEVVELRATLVPLLVRRLHVHGVVGEAGEGSLGVSRIPAVGDGLHQPDEGVVVHAHPVPDRSGSNGAGSNGGSAPRTSAATCSALPAPRITPSEP